MYRNTNYLCVYTLHKSQNNLQVSLITLATIILYRIIDECKRVCKTYHQRIGDLEDQKFDLEYIVKRKDMEVVRWAAMEQLPLKNSQNLQYFIFIIFLNFLWYVKCRVVYFDWFNWLTAKCWSAGGETRLVSSPKSI